MSFCIQGQYRCKECNEYFDSRIQACIHHFDSKHEEYELVGTDHNILITS